MMQSLSSQSSKAVKTEDILNEEKTRVHKISRMECGVIVSNERKRNKQYVYKIIFKLHKLFIYCSKSDRF